MGHKNDYEAKINHNGKKKKGKCNERKKKSESFNVMELINDKKKTQHYKIKAWSG